MDAASILGGAAIDIDAGEVGFEAGDGSSVEEVAGVGVGVASGRDNDYGSSRDGIIVAKGLDDCVVCFHC